VIELIKSKGTNRCDIAKALNVSNRTVYRWVKLETFPSIPKLIELAQYLKVKEQVIIDIMR